MVINMEDREVRNGDLFQHFKGMLYQIVGVAKHSETRELMVVYQALYGDYAMYVRPLEMFLSEVDKEKYPQVTRKYRFTKIDRSQLQAGSTQDKQTKAIELISAEPKAVELKTVEAKEIEIKPAIVSDTNVQEGLVNADLMEFLDAKDCGEKLEVLYNIRKRIDDRIMSDIEMSLDLPVGSGPVEPRIQIVRDNLLAMSRYEGRRLR
jgi:hypothetical protein